jgi:hypothetical protein
MDAGMLLLQQKRAHTFLNAAALAVLHMAHGCTQQKEPCVPNLEPSTVGVTGNIIFSMFSASFTEPAFARAPCTTRMSARRRRNTAPSTRCGCYPRFRERQKGRVLAPRKSSTAARSKHTQEVRTPRYTRTPEHACRRHGCNRSAHTRIPCPQVSTRARTRAAQRPPGCPSTQFVVRCRLALARPARPVGHSGRRVRGARRHDPRLYLL